MSDIKIISDNGLNFIVNEEGCILHPYLDSVGIPTIGIGNTSYESGRLVKITDPPITKERALSLFKNILHYYENAVSDYVISGINQNQFDSLVSLAYNIGTNAFKKSTVLRLVNQNPSDTEIAAAFKMWQNAGEKKGILLARRNREAQLYFSV